MSINFEDALKAKKLRSFFDEHGRIFILVDATSDEVMVPDFLKGDPSLPLVLNARMPQPIHIRDSFLESNFSFSGVSHHCVIPMRCIWATYLPDSDLSSGMIWHESMPEMVRIMMDQAQVPHEEQEPILASVPAAPGLEKKEGDSEPSKGRKVGHLRVVK